MILEIYKRKNVGSYRPDAFIVGIAFGLVNGTYSLYSGQIVSVISTGITCLAYALYLKAYTMYTSVSNRAIFVKLAIVVSVGCSITALGPVAFVITESTLSGHDWMASRGGIDKFVNIWLGTCATISVMLLYSGMLSSMVDVVKRKDASSISGYMVIGGLLTSVIWTVYASLILDPFYIVANGVGILSGTVLAGLKLGYGNKPALTEADSKSELVGEYI